MPDNIVLVGFSGTGKSTIALRLATRLGWPLVDVDRDLVDRFGKSIAQVFRDEGEPAFRTAERDAVVGRCSGSHQVISVGGGAPVDPVARAAIQAENFVVRLDAKPETILRRLKDGAKAEERPMLAGPDPLGRIRALLNSREDAYAIASFSVNTEDRTPDDVAEEVLSWVDRAMSSTANTGGIA